MDIETADISELLDLSRGTCESEMTLNSSFEEDDLPEEMFVQHDVTQPSAAVGQLNLTVDVTSGVLNVHGKCQQKKLFFLGCYSKIY